MDTFLVIWEKSLEILKQELASVRYDTWIKTLSPVKRINSDFYFQTLNPVHKELVEKSYKNLIVNAMSVSADLLDYNESVGVYFIDSEEAAKFRQPQPSFSENQSTTR